LILCVQVGRGKSEFSAAPRAADDAPGEGVTPPQTHGCFAHQSLRQELTHQRAGYHLTRTIDLELDGLNDSNPKFKFRRHFHERVNRPTAPLAESEIRPLHDVRGVKSFVNNLLHKPVCLQAQELGLARGNHHDVGAGLVKQPKFFVWRRKALRRSLRRHNAQRMGFKRQHDGRTTGISRQPRRLRDQLLMSSMNAIEVADGQRTPIQRLSQLLESVENTHRCQNPKEPLRPTRIQSIARADKARNDAAGRSGAVDTGLNGWCHAFVPQQDENKTPLNVALCVEGEALDRLGAVLSHLVVGLVDQAIPLRLVSSDEKARRLKLGPVQALIHPKIAWPFTEQRIDFMLSELQGNAPTVTHAMARESYRKAWAIAEAFDTDLVLTVTSLADTAHLAEFEISRPQRFVAMSEPLAATLRDSLKIPQDRVACVRPGVTAKDGASCFQDDARSATAICTAPLEKHTGIDLLIEAVFRLKREERNIMLFLLGQGRHESRLRKLVRDRELSSSVTFANPQGDIADVMESADIFVHLPDESALAIDGLRGMGAGMAVIGFEDAVSDCFQHEQTALVCPERSPDALVAALRRLIDDHPFAKALGDRGVEYARTHHSMSGMAEATATIYRQLALNRATFSLKE